MIDKLVREGARRMLAEALQAEVDAYIAAYAKGGEQVGTFPTQTKALSKAFELCPEG